VPRYRKKPSRRALARAKWRENPCTCPASICRDDCYRCSILRQMDRPCLKVERTKVSFPSNAKEPS
jgi:hypothetical protein